MKYFVLILICAAINSLDDIDEGYRKQYGFSFHKNCGNYFITFKCMTACKSMGFKVFRLDYKCKCTCHELKTTTILPAFVWRTNGTTKKRPATFSPKLYDIVGTLSPPPIDTVHTDDDNDFQLNVTAPSCQQFNNTAMTTNNTAMTTNVASNVTEPTNTNNNKNNTVPAIVAESSANTTQPAAAAVTTAAAEHVDGVN